MRLLADANIENQMAARLRADGHDVWCVREHDAMMKDEDVLAAARKTARVLVTYDLDFGELAVRRQEISHGVVILRLDPLRLDARIERASQAMKALSAPPPGVLCVIEPAGTRRRGGKSV